MSFSPNLESVCPQRIDVDRLNLCMSDHHAVGVLAGMLCPSDKLLFEEIAYLLRAVTLETNITTPLRDRTLLLTRCEMLPHSSAMLKAGILDFFLHKHETPG